MSSIKSSANHSTQSSAKTCESLKLLLAESYSLLLKTQNYHWNVTGPHFHQLHLMFEEQYQALFAAVDEVAERIRALGELAPGSYAEFAKTSKLKEGDNTLSAKEMVKDLVTSHHHIIDNCIKAIENARKEDDAVSEDLCIGLQTFHEKTSWMLQSLLDGWG